MKIRTYTSNELSWFYNNSLADIGVKSSWQSCCNAACYGNSQPTSDLYTDYMVSAISRRRLIERAIYALPEINQLALYCLYSWEAPSKMKMGGFYNVNSKGESKLQIENYYGKLALVACCILPADQLNELCSRRSRLKAAETALLLYVKVAAGKLKEDSIRLYNQQRSYK